MGGAEVAAYVANMKQLVGEKPLLFGCMVERQVQARLLPALAGSRVALERPLWELLMFCLDGAHASAPNLDDAAFERALAAAQSGSGLQQPTAAFPAAALAVLRAIGCLRAHGVYPAPRAP